MEKMLEIDFTFSAWKTLEKKLHNLAKAFEHYAKLQRRALFIF